MKTSRGTDLGCSVSAKCHQTTSKSSMREKDRFGIWGSLTRRGHREGLPKECPGERKIGAERQGIGPPNRTKLKESVNMGQLS